MRKLGLIVNPIAGMGGKVALKGTDGADVLAAARAPGAHPESGHKAAPALRALVALRAGLEVLPPSGGMTTTSPISPTAAFCPSLRRSSMW